MRFIFRIIRKIISFCLIIGIILGLVLTFLGHRQYKQAIIKRPISEVITELQSRDSYTSAEDLPSLYLEGVVAVEDHRFYSHPGFDGLAILRAAINDVRTRSFAEGGSTITQQLAKNLYFTHDKKLTRKIAEVFVALDLEKQYTKDEILEFYVNCIYFGRECYGISDASRVYFDCFPWELNDMEATILVGLPNGPKYFDPISNPKGAAKRQKRVIRDLVKRGYLKEEEAKKIKLIAIEKNPKETQMVIQGFFLASK